MDNRDGRTNEIEDKVQSVSTAVAETLDLAVDKASDFIAGPEGSKIVGGAAVGALAAIVLPFSIGVGAVLGAGYAAYRQLKK